MFTYIFTGRSHSDTSEQYMKGLGMTDEQIESVTSQKNYEEKNSATKKTIGKSN